MASRYPEHPAVASGSGETAVDFWAEAEPRGRRPWWTPVVAPIRLPVNMDLMESALVKEG